MLGILRRKLHASWLMAWLTAAVLCGIGLAYWVAPKVPFEAWWLIATIPLLFATFTKRTYGLLARALVADLLLGLWRGGIEQGERARYFPFYGHAVTLQGTVSEDPSYGPSGDQRAELKDVRLNATTMPAKVWVSLQHAPPIDRSDHITVQGKLGIGFGNIPASMFRAQLLQVIRPQPGEIDDVLSQLSRRTAHILS